jgi:hypothetical protein
MTYNLYFQIRVWGGGTYQPSSSSVAGGVYDFYSICDELGILAWSELIFSDQKYPINDFILESIEPEVRQNVRRVNKHPSNAQWAGGNEIEGIVRWSGEHFLNEVRAAVAPVLFCVMSLTTNLLSSLHYSETSFSLLFLQRHALFVFFFLFCVRTMLTCSRFRIRTALQPRVS